MIDYPTWRDIARPIIADVIRRHQGEELKVIRKALREAYPWGERKYWPYKVWCSEIRNQLGLNRKEDPKQLQLWGDAHGTDGS